MEGGAEFVACDMPLATRLTLHILAAVAEHETEMVSARTVAALAAAKARGVRLGNPRPDLAKARAAAFRGGVAPEIARLRNEGLSLGQIADLLNRCGLKAARGGSWHKASVAGVLREVGAV